MRTFIRALPSSVVTFTIGVLAAMAWSQLFRGPVSLCTLARNPEAYDGKLIRVEALGSITSLPMFSEHYIIIAGPECKEPDGWAIINLDETLRLSPEVDEFVNSTKPEIRKAKVVVEGRFDQWATPGCLSPRFGIKSAKVTLVSPVTSEPLPKVPTHDSH
jgi:hypothetical protein